MLVCNGRGWECPNSKAAAKEAEDYAKEGYLSGGQRYVAKIFLVSNSTGQGRMIIISGTADVEKGTMNKYISRVNDNNLSTDRVDTNYISRRNLSESQKKSNEVAVKPGEKIRYNIVITNTGNTDFNVTITDTFDSGLSFSNDNTATNCNTTWSRFGNYLYN